MRPIIFFACCCSVPLLAQNDPLFDHITSADGLPGNQVLSVFEDRQGYIWAGTSTGLARLEGTRVRVFHHDRNDSTSLAHDQVNGLAQDPHGGVWLATMAGLSRYDALSGGFTSFRVAASGNAAHQANRMLQLQCVGDTLIWIVSEQGLFRFDTRTRVFSPVEGKAAGSSPPGRVRVRGSLVWDAHRSGMWVASSKGLCFWDAKADRWTDHRNADKQQPWFDERFIAAPALQGRDTLWCFDERRYELLEWQLSSGVRTVVDSIEPVRNNFTLQWQQIDHDGRHWISLWTHRIFYRDPGSSWKEVVPSSTGPAALRSGNVASSICTRSGERWFATDAGIAVLRPANASLRVLTVPDNDHVLTELLSWGQDTLLIGTAGNGVYQLDLRTGATLNAHFERPAMPNTDVFWGNLITDLSRRDERSAWVGTAHGPAVLDIGSMGFGEASEFTLGPDPIGRTNVTFIRPSVNGGIWLGTWNRGLYLFDPVALTMHRTDTSGGPFGRLTSRMTLDWLTDRTGRTWLGLNDGGGLACLENSRFRAILDVDGGNLGGVARCLAEAPDGMIWIGTHEEGIIIYDPASGNTRYLNRKNGLPGVRVGRILFDRAGTVWAATAQGLASMSKDAVGFTSLALPDGLDPTELTSALAELPDGRIAFAVGKYLVLHDPLTGRAGVAAPRAVLTSVRIGDRVYHDSVPASALRLKADQKALTLELGALGLAPHTSALFRYRLAGTNTPWASIGAAQRIDLFDLPTGAHRIEVQASANGVDWSTVPSIIDLVVLPPFWSTWWFRVLLVALVASVLFTAFRLYLRERLRQQREAFQREQAILQERVRIAGDMHDDLGAGLSALKLRSEMALRVEKDPVKREQLGSLAHTAGDLIGSMRQIIWTMNGDQTSVEDLVVYTSNYVRTYCDQNGLSLTVGTAGPWPDARLSSEQRRNIFLVVKEALHNTVKHAHATAVRFEMRWSEGLEVELHDNGIGLPKGTEDAVGNGLRNMRKRISSLGGTLSMNGDDGSMIRFHVPIVRHP